LKDLQGDVIPQCYGGYTVNFEDRELHEDKSVNVILVEGKATQRDTSLGIYGCRKGTDLESNAGYHGKVEWSGDFVAMGGCQTIYSTKSFTQGICN
jgi:hypothetical protein